LFTGIHAAGHLPRNFPARFRCREFTIDHLADLRKQFHHILKVNCVKVWSLGMGHAQKRRQGGMEPFGRLSPAERDLEQILLEKGCSGHERKIAGAIWNINNICYKNTPYNYVTNSFEFKIANNCAWILSNEIYNSFSWIDVGRRIFSGFDGVCTHTHHATSYSQVEYTSI